MNSFKDNEFHSLKGCFLIAMPEMSDPFFSRAVVCICEHTPEGALGIVVNHPHSLIKTNQIFEEFDIKFNDPDESPLLIGGPVQLDEIFILHALPFIGQSLLKVTPEIALSNNLDTLKGLENNVNSVPYLVMLGCSGWGPGQLEQELMENAWLTTPACHSVIFEAAIEDRWDEAIKSAGIDPVLLNSTAGNA